MFPMMVTNSIEWLSFFSIVASFIIRAFKFKSQFPSSFRCKNINHIKILLSDWFDWFLQIFSTWGLFGYNLILSSTYYVTKWFVTFCQKCGSNEKSHRFWATPMIFSSRICSEGVNNFFIHFHTVRELNWDIENKSNSIWWNSQQYLRTARLSVVNLEEIWPQWNDTVEANVWRRIQSVIMIWKLPT